MDFKNICDKLGGVANVAKVVNIKSMTFIYRIIKGKKRLPKSWGESLVGEARKRIEELKRIIKEIEG
jgi:hypothetical protein